jgi:hypothetical protein
MVLASLKPTICAKKAKIWYCKVLRRESNFEHPDYFLNNYIVCVLGEMPEEESSVQEKP